jgi:NAD-dependent DNA ligase
VQTIQAPTNCPSCSSLLEWSNDLLYCRSPLCSAQKQKKVEHFAKTLKIKGLGPSAITKLGLVDIDQIYTLSQDEITEGLSSEKLAEKLYAEIKNSEAAPLNTVLAAFSIPLIGKTASDKLSKVIRNINEINESSCKEAGLGPKATQNLLEWLQKDFYSFYDGYLPFTYEFEAPVQEEQIGTVCISGKLKSFKTKALAAEALERNGYVVKSSLTKDVTILINESGIESAKTTQARKAGVTIIENLLDLIGE